MLATTRCEIGFSLRCKRAKKKKVREELRRAVETIADLRSELDHERNYISRAKKERDKERARVEDALVELDAARHEPGNVRALLGRNEAVAKQKIPELEANLADALRKTNRERYARDLEVRKNVTMDAQRGLEKALRAMLDKCGHDCKASGVSFDAEASSSEDEHPVAAPTKTAEPTLGGPIAAIAPSEVAKDLPAAVEIRGNGCGEVENPAPSQATGCEGLPAASRTSSDSSSTTSSESKSSCGD